MAYPPIRRLDLVVKLKSPAASKHLTVMVPVGFARELVEPGQLPPDQVHTPGIFVDAIFQGERYVKRIEKRTTRKAVE